MFMRMTNQDIYYFAQNLTQAFSDSEQRLPARLSFFIHKNKETLFNLAQEIEKARVEILSHYGKEDLESLQFIINPEYVEIAQQELQDLFDLEQEVNINKISLNALNDDISLTNQQMSAIMFMIDEE